MGLSCACACGTPGLLFSLPHLGYYFPCHTWAIIFLAANMGVPTLLFICHIVDVSGWAAVLMATST
jgi:hypothetical protein